MQSITRAHQRIRSGDPKSPARFSTGFCAESIRGATVPQLSVNGYPFSGEEITDHRSAVIGQQSEVRGQTSEGRGQRSEGRGQRAEGRGMETNEPPTLNRLRIATARQASYLAKSKCCSLRNEPRWLPCAPVYQSIHRIHRYDHRIRS
jgi:hypothetical protein